MTFQEREKLIVQQHVYERDLADLREKLSFAQRNLNATTGDMQVQDATIRGLRGNFCVINGTSNYKGLHYTLSCLFFEPLQFDGMILQVGK